MAEIKKYLDTAALGALVDQIKAEDAKALKAAKDYADGLASNYEEAGKAATAEQNSKAYTDQLANGQVRLNKEAIEKLNGADTVEGSVAKTVKDAQDVLQGNIDAVDDKADANAEAIAAINNAETGILKQAKDYADAEDAKVEQMVADLETYVGEIPEEAEATNIVAYVQEKTSGIATDAALGELQATVTQLGKDIDAVEADYLKAADKTGLEGKITAEQQRAEGVESGLNARIKAVEDDYLKAADKTELTQAIAAAKEEAVTTILGGAVDEDFDTLKEVSEWILSDTTGAAALQTDVATLKQEMDAVEADMEQAQKDIDAVEAAVATKAEAQALTDAVAALEGADAGQVERIAALEAKFGAEGEGTVADQIADAKQEAIDAAAGDATTKANKALEDAKKYADEEDAKIELRLDTLEAIDHEHANKALLDTYTQTEANLADAVAKKHAHDNKAVLDGITSEKVTAWDSAEQNAKTFAQGLNDTMQGVVDGIDGRVGTLESTITTKADASALAEAVADITENAEAIAANTSAINSFTAITSDEVNALFA